MKAFFKKLSFAVNVGKEAWKIVRNKDSKTKTITQAVWQIYEIYKEGKMESKLKSRKFWVTIVPAITMILGAFLKPEAVENIKEVLLGILGLCGTYNIGQGMVDAKKEGNKTG